MDCAGSKSGGFISDAFNHLKVAGFVPAAEKLPRGVRVTVELADHGVLPLHDAGAIIGVIATATKTHIWEREPKVRNIP